MTPGPLLFAAVAGQLASLLASRRMRRLWLVLTVGSAACACTAAVFVLFRGPAWTWRGGPAIGGAPLHLRLDGLSAFFVVLLSIIDAVGAVFSDEYWPDNKHPRSAAAGRLWWSVLVLSLAVVLTVSNGLHFLFGWELFAVSAYFLMTLERRNREVRSAGRLYLNASHAATLTLFAFFAILAARTGSWDLGPMRDRTDLAPLFWLALFAFGIKAGAFPLHIWLPSAHANAPSHVSAILSGVTLKVAIYGILRFSGWLPVPPAAGWTVAAIGAASAVLGVAFALGQHDLKRLLAYHSVENIGIILIGMGFAIVGTSRDGAFAPWALLALAGALLHVWNHGLFKSLLFLGAGSVLHATHTREMSRLGGLWRALPWTTALFALGAVAICGLPPLNGFVSEWLVYLGLFGAVISRGTAAWAVVPAAILLGVTGALALACFTKVCGVVFMGAARSPQAAHARECGIRMRGPMLLLAAACVAIGLAPVVFWPALVGAAGAWRPGWASDSAPASLSLLGWAAAGVAAFSTLGAIAMGRRIRRFARRAPTWDCGYAAPTPRMQYTAGSFAATVTEWFTAVLRPRTHIEAVDSTFPVRASFERHTPEVVLECIVEPIGAAVLRLSATARRLQHGRVQFYVLYSLAAVAAMIGVVAMSAAR